MSNNLNEELGQGRKFILTPNHLGFGPNLILLSDYVFWSSNYAALEEWCERYGGTIAGMTVNFDNQQEVAMFILRWS